MTKQLEELTEDELLHAYTLLIRDYGARLALKIKLEVEHEPMMDLMRDEIKKRMTYRRG